jgi:hypothetical protein
MKYLLLFVIPVVYAISNGANEPIADNQLGLTAKDCALQFCQDKDGMALWLSLVQECSAIHANPYFKEEVKESVCFRNESEEVIVVTPMTAGMICSMMSLVSVFVGYGMYDIFYKKENKEEIRYQELSTKEID